MDPAIDIAEVMLAADFADSQQDKSQKALSLILILFLILILDLTLVLLLIMRCGSENHNCSAALTFINAVRV